MVDVAPLVADGGQLRLVRRLAAFAYGERTVEWPDDFDGPEKDLPDDRVFGYVAKLPGKSPGRSERRFTRSDIQIDAVNHTSTTEQVLDAAERKTGGDAFVETVISGRGLGRQVPGVDFRLGDRVPVRLWGRILPGQLVTEVSWEGTVPSVKVGGQVLADLEALDRDVLEQKRAIAQERRERRKDVGQAIAVAGKAQSSADSAKLTADGAVSDVRDVRETLGGPGASGRTLAEQLGALNAQLKMQGEEPQPGLLPAYLDLNTRLWEQQQQINAANEAFKTQQKQINDAVDSSAQDQADLIESMARQLDSLRSQLAAVSGSVWQVGAPGDGMWRLESEPYGFGDYRYFLVAEGSWVGKAIVDLTVTKGSVEKREYTFSTMSLDVGTTRRFLLSEGYRSPSAIIHYRVDSGRARNRSLTIGPQTANQSYRSLLPRFTTPDASTYAINVDLTWLNTHRGALYGIRVMTYTKGRPDLLAQTRRDTIGPLGPAGNGRRTMTLAVNKALDAGVEISVEAMCDHEGEFQRQVDGGSVNISWIV